ncbi:cysteine peptidase family C39 domain-containing protein [Neisseria sp. Ec49-e6-T10]|uniref:cysteine peptidase family C39 domain-containing protein n=1 Tax=Neisseria sp. Ec49-e6-T10 TaxID=3140744 RepID=UPI003EB93C8A
MIHSVSNKYLYLIVSFIFALLSLSIPVAYLSDAIGANPLYAQFRATPYTELFIVFFSPFTGALSSYLANHCNHSKPRHISRLILCLLITLFYTSIPFIKPLIRPLPQHTIGHQWFKGIALQTTPSTCGPSSLATILKGYGTVDTEANIAKQAFSSSTGTENWYLARYAHQQGYQYRFLHEPELGKVPTPSIIGVKLGRIGHFITLLGHNGDTYTIADSLDGLHHLTTEEFKQRYVYNGFVLHIEKSAR